MRRRLLYECWEQTVIPMVEDHIDLDGERLEGIEMDKHRISLLKFQNLALDGHGKVGLASEKAPEEKSE